MTQLSFQAHMAALDTDPRTFQAEEADTSGSQRMLDLAQIRRFVLGGNARFTLVSGKTGQRFTYRVRASKDGRVHFVSLLNGPDNESAYAYFGYIRPGPAGALYFHGGSKARVGADAPSARGFAWFWNIVMSSRVFPTSLQFWHEGRCGRCGRTLTVPESIATGFGPECATRIRS